MVLGGNDGDRSLRALGHYNDGYEPTIVLTGLAQGVAAPPAYLVWRAEFREARDVPRMAIPFELDARNSFSDAEQLVALMRKEAWHTLIVVSDPPHMRGLARTWARVFDRSGLSCVLGSSEPDWRDEGHWWRDEKGASLSLSNSSNSPIA